MLGARVECAKKKFRNSSKMRMLRDSVKIRATVRGSTRTGKVCTVGGQSGYPASGKPRLERSELELFERSEVNRQRSNCWGCESEGVLVLFAALGLEESLGTVAAEVTG